MSTINRPKRSYDGALLFCRKFLYNYAIYWVPREEMIGICRNKNLYLILHNSLIDGLKTFVRLSMNMNITQFRLHSSERRSPGVVYKQHNILVRRRKIYDGYWS